MAKFSLVGDEEDGEGPSVPRRKRQRTTSASTSTSNGVGITIEENRAPQPLPETVEEHEEEEEQEEGEGESEEVESEEEEELEEYGVEEEGEEEEEEEEEDGYGEEEEERDPEEEIEEIDQEPRSATIRVVGRPRSSSNSNGLSSAVNQEASISVTLTDPDVLDCSICFEPLTIPVYQCENGHVACSSCCSKLKNKCPSCSWPIGYNRCRAIEKVLEAVRISCPNKYYGCKELVRYSEKKIHESTCIHSPCTCPHLGCGFVSSAGTLYQHFRSKHLNCAIRFHYNRTFPVTLDANEKFQIFQEKDVGVIFLLNNSCELLGNVLTVSCIWHCSFGGFFYSITAKTQGNSIQLQSFTECTKSRVNSIPATGFLLVPRNFRNSSSELKLEICIWSKGSSPMNFQRSINVV